MTPEARLEALKQEQERQDEAWQQVTAALSRMGDEPIAVPGEALEQLTAPTPAAPQAPVVFGVRA